MSEVTSIPVQAVAPIPGPIVSAVCQIQVTVEAIKKTHRNQHGNYTFASTDDIYAGLTRKMGEVGLICLAMEDRDVEIIRVEKDGKTSQWAKFVFVFVLATKDSTWTDPKNRRTLYIQVTGPQTFQAANSYAEKSYLKSLFKLPTGDMDLDSMPQGDTEEDQVALSGIGKAKRKSSAEGKRDGSVKKFNALRADITAAQGAIECREVWVRSADFLSTAPRAWYETLLEDYSVAMGGFGVEVDLPEQSELMPQAAE